MGTKIRIEDAEYTIDDLSENGKFRLALFKFTEQRLHELNNLQAVLQRAKNSYVEVLRREVLADKAGILLDD